MIFFSLEGSDPLHSPNGAGESDQGSIYHWWLAEFGTSCLFSIGIQILLYPILYSSKGQAMN